MVFSPTLRELERCLGGVIPATIATAALDGTPNITNLSVVHRVDDEHLALSFQFFKKTRENVLANPRAQIIVVDPATMEQYRIDVVYTRTETSGPSFERLRVHLDAVASQTRMQSVFRLRGADIYRVLRIDKLAHDLDLSTADAPPDRIAALEALSRAMAEHDDLRLLLATTLDGLAEHFDCPASLILFADGEGQRLYTVASRGFAESGVGAEITVGEGIIGRAASERHVVRIDNFQLEHQLVEASRVLARQQGIAVDERPEIALPGLPQVRSQIAVPLLARERVLGVLCVQSAEPGRFVDADERALVTLGRYLATQIQVLEQLASDGEPVIVPRTPATNDIIRVRHHAADDSIFIDEEYVIKGLAGRILARLFASHARDGRVDFSNKELRADESLGLASYRDNLEARLVLLRTRLTERTPRVRIERTGRGRFRLVLDGALAIEHAR